jgi:pimeloyl-ACP methyl ester carboxylesterase
MPAVLALHGFTRGPQHLVAFSEACERRGLRCIRPSLAPRWFPIMISNRRHLTSLARRLVVSGQISEDTVIVGHSAGAAAGAWLAPILRNAGVHVAGVVFVEGNDSPNHLIQLSWQSLRDLPVRAVMAPPNPCNKEGELAVFLNQHRPGSVLIVPGSGHGDIEMSGAGIYRRICHDASGPNEWRTVQQTVLSVVGEMFE